MELEDELRDNIRYDPETGLLWWKKRSSGRRFNKPVGSTSNTNGYVQICFRFMGKDLMLQGHRVAWLLHFGNWPENLLDHKDRNRINNRIVNLREATDEQNAWNHTMRKDNKSGFRGVYLCKRSGKYRVNIRIDGKYVSLGSFDTAEEASVVYTAKTEELRGKFSATDP